MGPSKDKIIKQGKTRRIHLEGQIRQGKGSVFFPQAGDILNLMNKTNGMVLVWCIMLYKGTYSNGINY